MGARQLASIIINNYNYGRFLKDAINSALSQSYANTEVVVVDDGSTDNSREIIAGYGDRIRPVLKENGGQPSALNAGFPATRGQVIIILDSDDMLVPSAMAEAVKRFNHPNIVKVHWPLWIVDERGRNTGQMLPGVILPEGNQRDVVIRDGPVACVSPPTSGNAWSRRFLEKVLPMPEPQFKQHADSYLLTLAPIFGDIKMIAQPQAYYRIHGGNDFACEPSNEKNRRRLKDYDHCCEALSGHLAAMGINTDPEVWKQRDAQYEWMQRQDQANEETTALTPPGSTLILVDEGNFADVCGSNEVFPGRHTVPFLEKEGQYWGAPPDDATAIRELERLRHSGASFMVFAWPAFWWLDYYSGLHRYLGKKYRCILRNEYLVVFDLLENCVESRHVVPEFYP